MPPAGLDIDLQDVTANKHLLRLAEAFVARNPDDALRWICSQTTRGKILTLIKDDATDKADDATEGPHDELDGARDVTDANRSGRHGVKRKRALREKTTTTSPAGLLTKEQRYKRFATGLLGIRVNAVAQMIAKASAVGIIDVFRDWQAILAVWKQQSYYGKKLFETVAMPFRECDQAQGNTTDKAGLTAFEMEAFAYKYFDAQKTQVDGMADEIRHRWKMDELGRGVRYSDVAKEHLFSLTYKSLVLNTFADMIELLFLACMDESALLLENQAHDDREGQADRERNVIGDTMQATLKDWI
ncbi:hypothetical protein K504DRAFT_466274 [Pleomassaria siparia CBS 279.74]|uniref:Uncharacterized protein n=1 Tax=Pleomassaria siparia CBS 279.74 TaxID=1314801 RepID=A0A6G1JPI2_9PLEO|nr:hypothetical protein K504DRAFT_466274 [Pleomassaria siparia CBS 279.74]